MIPHLDQWAVWAATEAEAAEGVVPTWVKLVITLGVFLIPYALGVLIARQLKLKEYAFKISVVLVAATLGVMPFVYQSILASYEQQHYEERLAEWEAARKEAAIQPEDIEEIKEDHPELIINRPQANAPPPKLSSAGE